MMDDCGNQVMVNEGNGEERLRAALAAAEARAQAAEQRAERAGGAAVSAPPVDLRRAVANSALRDDQAIMVGVGALRSLLAEVDALAAQVPPPGATVTLPPTRVNEHRITYVIPGDMDATAPRD